MTKSTAIVFILFFSILFRLERKVGVPCLSWLLSYLFWNIVKFLFWSSVKCKKIPFCLQRSSLIVIVGLIALGLFLFTFRSTSFNLDGFLLVLLASATSGLRWTLAQLLSQPSPRNAQLSRQTSSAVQSRGPSRSNSHHSYNPTHRIGIGCSTNIG